MLDLRLFRDRRFSVASGGMTLVFFAMFGTFFLVSQYLQLVLGYPPSPPACSSSRWPLMMMLLAPAGRRAGRPSYGAAPWSPTGLAHAWRSACCCSRRWASTRPIWLMYGPLLLLGRRHGDHDAAPHGADHVVGAAGQGRCRLGHERHHPGARRGPRRGRARLARDLDVHVGPSTGTSAGITAGPATVPRSRA